MAETEKRTELKNKVDSAQKRNQRRKADRSVADYARNAGQSTASFVKQHPITTLVGAAAVGILIASVVPGPGRRLRKQATKRGAALAGVLADLAVTYGTQALESAGGAARAGQHKLGDLGEAVGDGARTLRRGAGGLAEDAGSLGRDAGKRAARTFRDLRSRMAN